MKISCPGCGSALVYDINSKKMICHFCNAAYDNIDNQEESDEIECNLYICKSCGAELMVNDVETATCCAYCQQPTIVFDRISRQKRPKYIIPFAIDKATAERNVREKVGKGLFVPKEIKDFKVEQIRGIYIPYYISDIDYEDRMIIKSSYKRNKTTYHRYHIRHARNEFKGFTMEASRKLNDDSSIRLEPFDTDKLIPFDAKYLSGYYADCSDVPVDELMQATYNRSKKFFDAGVLDTVTGSDKKVMESDPKVKFKNIEYVMLPVWFLVSNINGKPHTIMINGQTGKVVGSVPVAKGRMYILATFMSIILGIGNAFLTSFLAVELEDTALWVAGLAALVGFILASTYMSDLKFSHELTTADEIKDFTVSRTDMNQGN